MGVLQRNGADMMGYNFHGDDVHGLACKIGATVKEKGNELFFRWCPYCHGDGHDKDTFSVNMESGLFKCFRSSCGRQGHFVQLARDFNYPLDFGNDRRQYRELPQRPIITKNAAVTYMESRGISKAVTEQYRITTRNGDDKVLVFPFYDENKVLRYVKYRKTNFDKRRHKNKEWGEKDTMPILFGMDQCVGFERLVITEGQIDSLSVVESGIKNAVSVPNGARGFTWMENCWDWLNKFSEVVVFGDYEKGKITLVDEIVRRLSCPVKVARKEDYLGEKDANDILRKYGRAAVRQAIEQAEVIPINHVKRLADVENVDLQSLPHVITGIYGLDKVIGGLYFGQVILLTGKRGEGKSTLMGQFVAEAINQGHKVLAYSGELPDYHFKRWLDLQIAGPEHIKTKYNQFSDPVYYLDNDTVEKINNWYYDMAYLYDNNAIDGEDEYSNLIDTIEQAVCRYGIKLVCVDNLMTAIDITSSENQYVQQSKFVRSLKQIAVKHDVTVVLVAHPRKTQGEISDNDAVSGSSDITNRVDVVMSYIKNGEEHPGGKIMVLKNRMTGKLAAGDHAVKVEYDEKSKRIYMENGTPYSKYGWERKTADDTSLYDLPF